MKTREDFEQMVLDTRPDLDRAIERSEERRVGKEC